MTALPGPALPAPALTLSPPKAYNRTLFMAADVVYTAALFIYITQSPYDAYHRAALLAAIVMLVAGAVRRTDLALWLSAIVSLAAMMYFLL